MSFFPRERLRCRPSYPPGTEPPVGRPFGKLPAPQIDTIHTESNVQSRRR
jgi:hypothetical protein